MDTDEFRNGCLEAGLPIYQIDPDVPLPYLGNASATSLAGRATIDLETDDGEYGIGDWRAVLEDVKADGIIETVTYRNGEEDA